MKPTPQQVLDLEFEHDTMGMGTVRDYFKTLLTDLWEQAEGFSSKRPFGNSDWQYDLYIPLIQAGYVEGKIDPDMNEDVEVDYYAADALIFEAIAAL